MDDISIEWQEDRYNEIVENLIPILKQAGYDPDMDCVFIPVSGLQNQNITKPLEKSICKWYKDERYLCKVLEDLPLPLRNENGPLRIRVHQKLFFGHSLITGMVESGTIKLGDELKAMPSDICY